MINPLYGMNGQHRTPQCSVSPQPPLQETGRSEGKISNFEVHSSRLGPFVSPPVLDQLESVSRSLLECPPKREDEQRDQEIYDVIASMCSRPNCPLHLTLCDREQKTEIKGICRVRHHPAGSACRSQKRLSAPLGLEFQKVVSHCVGDGNRTWVPWKIHQCC